MPPHSPDPASSLPALERLHMHRRNLLASLPATLLTPAVASFGLVPPQAATSGSPSLSGSAPAPQAQPKAGAAPGTPREFYLLSRFQLTSGPQTNLTEQFFTHALIPALNRLGHAPVGAFRLTVGPDTPAFYLLVPGRSADHLLTTQLQLAQDEQFLQAAEPFWAAPATAPSFIRAETALLAAFPGWPRLTPPPPGPRIFQLRTYESPSFRDHTRKMEMFHNGEFDIFRNAGFHQVFYGTALAAPRLPHLTYMLSFPDQATLDASWARFSADPAWQKLSHDPRYSFEELVSNITNLILSPLACSQI